MAENLYRIRNAPDADETTLVVAFDGWVDAGSAATLAAARLAADGEIVATFHSDLLYDYRSRRPTLEIVDGRARSLTWPRLTVRRSMVGERQVLVLTGPEPDLRWHALSAAAVELARQLSVTEWIGLGAIQAAVPHTRPVPVLGIESRPGLLRGEASAGLEGVLRVPAALLSVLDVAVARAGIPTLGYFAQVPHYVTGPYPAAAVELLRVLGLHFDGTIPPGTLDDEAREMRSRLDTATVSDETARAYVGRLESMVDESRLPSGDDLISEIERFLRDQNHGGSREP